MASTNTRVAIKEEFEVVVRVFDGADFILIVDKVSVETSLLEILGEKSCSKVLAGVVVKSVKGQTNPSPLRSEGNLASGGRPDQRRRNMVALMKKMLFLIKSLDRAELRVEVKKNCLMLYSFGDGDREPRQEVKSYQGAMR